jgi:integrase
LDTIRLRGIQKKLAKAGLIALVEQKTCRVLCEAFLEFKRDSVKPRTMEIYQTSQKHFFKEFSHAEPIENITQERLLKLKHRLRSTHSEAGTASVLKDIQTICNWAVSQDWLLKNPMAEISLGSFVNRNKDRSVSMEQYAQILTACPTQGWRVIVALARIGGLRPSEIILLRWSDIHWDKNYFRVWSSKTERYERHRERLIPLFTRIRKELEPFLSERKVGKEDFLFPHFQGKRVNLGTLLNVIVRRAGLETIVRPFDNMRASRSNEILRKFDCISESHWIGHSRKVMLDHYFQMSDEYFAEAVKRDE